MLVHTALDCDDRHIALRDEILIEYNAKVSYTAHIHHLVSIVEFSKGTLIARDLAERVEWVWSEPVPKSKLLRTLPKKAARIVWHQKILPT